MSLHFITIPLDKILSDFFGSNKAKHRQIDLFFSQISFYFTHNIKKTHLQVALKNRNN